MKRRKRKYDATVDRVEPLSPPILLSAYPVYQRHWTRMRDAMQVVPAEQLTGEDRGKRERQYSEEINHAYQYYILRHDDI